MKIIEFGYKTLYITLWWRTHYWISANQNCEIWFTTYKRQFVIGVYKFKKKNLRLRKQGSFKGINVFGLDIGFTYRGHAGKL
jgi:hypothetical protein